MQRRMTLCLVTACTLAGVLSAAAPHQGDWTIRQSKDRGMIRLTLMNSGDDGHYQSSSTYPANAFSGLDVSRSGRQDVEFSMVRDAGRVDFRGYLLDGEGAGLFDFTPDADFAGHMEQLDFDLEPDLQFAMALHDVSLTFARQMRDAELTGLDSSKLIAFRVHGVSQRFIDELRAVGQPVRDSGELIAFRVHGVSAQMVERLRDAGYEPDNGDLIALRVHGATPEWVDELKREGYDRLALDEMVAFRIHGVSPEFIRELASLGYDRPDADDLIAMRVHGVTPSFITGLQSRGMDHLSIQQLVGLKIHGLD